MIPSTRENIKSTKHQKGFNGASCVEAIAYWLPEKIITAEEIESTLKVDIKGVLNLKRSMGMHSKRILGAPGSVVEMCNRAAQKMFESGTLAGKAIEKSRIDAVIYFSVIREYREPATAAILQESIGLQGAISFDLTDACMGFADAWYVADMMIATGRAEKVLVIGAEICSPISDIAVRDINQGANPHHCVASLTLGDGAVAAIISNSQRDTGQRIQLLAGLRETYSNYHHAGHLPQHPDKGMYSEPGTMFSAVMRELPEFAARLQTYYPWTKTDISALIMHQASTRGCEKASAILDIDPSRTLNLFRDHGNMASVSLPLALAKYYETNRQPQKILLLGLGAGMGLSLYVLQVV